jgi:methylamine dehydrogenase heavy chain
MEFRPMIDRLLFLGALLGTSFATVSHAQTFDRIGRSEVLPAEPERDWVFIGTSLVDVVDDRFLGVVGVAGGGGPIGYPLAFSADRRSIFTIESFYSRGNRGERTDTVTIFDSATLGVAGEVVIPSKSALMLARDGAIALSDDNRFLAVFNLTPATSLSIVDVERLVFVAEIATPGCSLAYGAGERRYVMLCANGALLTVTVDEEGREVSKVRTEGFFDPRMDPITEAAVRYADEWLFVSFDGMAHPLDVSAEPAFGPTWSLLTDSDRAEDWRIAGVQHLAVHEASGRLYSLVRQSEEPLDDPKGMDGQEVWVYDLERRRRVARWAALPETEEEQGPGGGGPSAIGASSGDGAARILVTGHDEPLLVTVGAGGVSVRDGMSGEYIHSGLTNVPAGGRLTAY